MINYKLYRIVYHNGIVQTKKLISHSDYLTYVKTSPNDTAEEKKLKIKIDNYFTDQSPLFDAIKDGRLVLPKSQGGVHLCFIQPLEEYKENENYVEYSKKDLHSFSDMGRYVCVVTSQNIFRELDKLYIDHILEVRKIIRKQKQWFLSDIVRSYLDEKNVFVFDTKDFQEVYYWTDSSFKNMSKIEKLYNIKFRIKRDFVEWTIKRNIQSEKTFDAWVYSTLASVNNDINEKYSNYLNSFKK